MTHYKLSVCILFIILFSIIPSVFAAQVAVIDFEGLSEGQIVTSLSSGAGISGPNLGSVAVTGNSNNVGGPAAMTFNSNCSGASCSGEDIDLGLNMGLVLILTEDGNTSDPDDAANGGNLSFNFSAFGNGFVTVNTLAFLDIEETGGTVQVTLLDSTVLSYSIPATGDSTLQSLAINAENVVSMRVNFIGSGALDNVRVQVEDEEEPPTGGQGCTPGYWRQEHHYGAWTGLTPDMIYSDVFGVGPAISLGEAVQTNGGGENALLRHSTAALLNANNPNVAYPYSASEVILMTQEAFSTADYEATKDLFDAANNLGCPLGRNGVPNNPSTARVIQQPSFFDGRINNFDDAAPVVAFGYDSGTGRGLVIYSPFRQTLLTVSPEEIAAVGELPEENTLIASNEEHGLYFYRLSTGEFQINARTPEGKTYTLIFASLYTNSGYVSFEEWIR